MTANLRYWQNLIRDAEAALDAAEGLSELKIAAQRLMRAREALLRLQPTGEASATAQ